MTASPSCSRDNLLLRYQRGEAASGTSWTRHEDTKKRRSYVRIGLRFFFELLQGG